LVGFSCAVAGTPVTLKEKTMECLLDFENPEREKGYKPFKLTAENIKANIGKKICYVDSVDKYRGYYTVKYGVIYMKHYSRLLLDEGEREVDIRDVKACGIEIEQPAPPTGAQTTEGNELD
jgi:hypothetical protein